MSALSFKVNFRQNPATTDRPTADTAVLVYWQWTPPVCMRIGFTYMREEWSDAVSK